MEENRPFGDNFTKFSDDSGEEDSISECDISECSIAKSGPIAVIIGMPAAGKTRVGSETAKIMQVPFADSDEIIEQTIGTSISNYFNNRGQKAFRDIEARIVRALVEGESFVDALRGTEFSFEKSDENIQNFDVKGGILSLGGGAPINEITKKVLQNYAKRGGCIIYLQVSEAEAIERISWNNNRPMLQGKNGAERWNKLYEQRDPIFRLLANSYVRVHGATPHMAAEKVRSMIMQHIVHVTGEGIEPYDVRIGDGVMQLLPQILGEKPVRVALVHTQPVQRHSDKARTILRQSGYEVFDMIIPDAEAGKTIKVASGLWANLAEAGFTRSDAIVGLGGGAATDSAGFVAATWMRGIRYVNCPTSLLAMVDASTGGKTGINTDAGKNLVGSFYTPAGVLADTSTLATLPNDILIEGLGEVAKSGFICDCEILKLLSDAHNAELLRKFNGDLLENCEELHNLLVELIERTVRVKAYHVSNDLKEQGLREFLNYGHTLGHAIEQIEHFRWRHGNAVAVGMVFAAELAQILGYLDAEDVTYHRSLLKSLGLPISWNGSEDDESAFERVLNLMHRDKKARGNMLRFVILDGISNPIHLDNPPIEAVQEAFRRVYKQN